jgi:hypothetical protein
MKKNNYFLFALFILLGVLKINAQAITYSFANAQITNDGMDDFYEADILLSTDTDFKLGIGQFFLNYNTAAFGTNINASGNLVFSHPDGAGGTYILDERFGGILDVYVPTVGDNNSSRIGIAWTQGLGAVAIPTTTAAGSPHLLLHLKIKYIDVNQDPMISFDPSFEDLTFNADTNPGSGDGTQITDDTYNSTGSALPAATNTWTGATDSDWDTASNWSLATVPTGTSDVIIPSGVTTPVSSGDISVNNLTLNANASLTVGGTLTHNGEIILNSAASLIAKNTPVPTPSLTYRRNLPTNNWYLISSPVKAYSIVNFTTNNSLALGSGTGVNQNIALATYNNVNDGWNYYTFGQVDGLNVDDTTDNLNSLQGYSIKPAASGDIIFKGTIETANRQIDINIGAGSSYNLVGNPYPSYIALNANTGVNINSLLGRNGSSSLDRLSEDTAWFWDGATSKYIAVNQASPARYVAPGQGFFISANSSTFFLFAENMQSHQSTDVFNRTANTRPEIKVALSNGSELSTTDIYYITGTTTEFDNGYDSTVFDGTANDFLVYTHHVTNSQGEDLAIQSLPDSNYDSMMVPVGVNALSGSEITFSLDVSNFPAGTNVYLEDRQENTFILIDDTNSSYTTVLNDDLNGIGRFYIHTTASVLNIDNNVLENVSVYKTSNTNLRITGLQNGATSIKLYSVLGQQVLRSTFEANNVNNILLPSSLRVGVYIVQVKNAKGTITKKIVIE